MCEDIRTYKPQIFKKYAIAFVVTAMQSRGLWFSFALYDSSVSYFLALASLHYSGIEKLK
jgi:hypothetical protein